MVVGTLVSQTLLNVLALVILGVVMFSTVGLFAGKEQALIWYAAAPVAVVALVLRRPRSCAPGCRRAPRASRAGCGWRAPPRRASATG